MDGGRSELSDICSVTGEDGASVNVSCFELSICGVSGVGMILAYYKKASISLQT